MDITEALQKFERSLGFATGSLEGAGVPCAAAAPVAEEWLARSKAIARQQLGSLALCDQSDIYAAMQPHLLSATGQLDGLFDHPDLTSSTGVECVVRAIVERQPELPGGGFALRRGAAEELLRRHEPPHLMHVVLGDVPEGQRTLARLLRRVDPVIAISLVRYSETREWLEGFAELLGDLSPSDFERRGPRVLVLEPKMWGPIADRVYERRPLHHSKLTGYLVATPFRSVHSLAGLRLALKVIGHFKELELWLRIWQAAAEEPASFGARVRRAFVGQAVSDDPPNLALLLEGATQIRCRDGLFELGLSHDLPSVSFLASVFDTLHLIHGERVSLSAWVHSSAAIHGRPQPDLKEAAQLAWFWFFAELLGSPQAVEAWIVGHVGVDDRLPVINPAQVPVRESTTKRRPTVDQIETKHPCTGAPVTLHLDPDVAAPNAATELLLQATEQCLQAWGEGARKIEVLEVGSGHGLLPKVFAGRVKRIVATDLNPRAVQLTQRNTKGLDNVEVRLGDLMAPVTTIDPLSARPRCEQFHVIVANLPWMVSLPGIPLDPRDPFSLTNEGGRRGREVLDRFLGQAACYLRPGGLVLLVHGAFVGVDETREKLERQGLATRIVGTRDVDLPPGSLTVARRSPIRGETGYRLPRRRLSWWRRLTDGFSPKRAAGYYNQLVAIEAVKPAQPHTITESWGKWWGRKMRQPF